MNKKKATKGHYGYLEARKKGLLIRGCVLLVGIIVLVVTGLIAFKTRNNLLTVVAVVTALPMGMQFATFFTILKYKSRPREEYEQVEKIVGNGILDTELVLSSRTAKTMDVAYAYIHESGIYIFTDTPGIDVSFAETHIKDYLKKNDVDTHVKVFTEFKKFTNRLEQLTPEDRDTCDDVLLKQEGVLRAIAM